MRVDIDLFDLGVVHVRLERTRSDRLGVGSGTQRALGVLVEQTIAALQPRLIDAGDLLCHPSPHQQLETGAVLA